MKGKRLCILVNVCLWIWFFLDMFGMKFGDAVLVEAAWYDIDGIMFCVFTVLTVLFFIRPKYAKYPVTVFLALWLVTQFFSHWYYTLFGATETKLSSYADYFGHTLKLFPETQGRIIPDLYHTVLHLMIITALICMIIFCIKNKKQKT